MPEPAPRTDREHEESIFYRALDLPAEARAEFVAGACGANPLLRQRLTALLSAHDSSAGFLEQPAASRLPADPELLPGGVIGRYQLVREIGEGGSGVVFHAHQLEPIQRDVALKVIKLGMDTREVIARFETERQALALLDHPGIAHVLDAGATASGRPFFVMDLVEGTPITRFADHQRLTVRERVELIIGLCAALEHAHQKGVIHRDLKPSNILVSAGAGAPRARIIDFGIAKAAYATRPHTVATALGTFLGTPGYLSPEQAQSGVAVIDTRADIYGLGALLYELLTGAPPFGRELGPDLLRKLREEEPARPALSLRRLPADQLLDRAATRRTTPDGLLRAVTGDLDWIALKCLERDPTRRYATVGELAADLQRHLAFAPVRARPPSRFYVLGRLIRRHRALSGVIAVSVLLLAAASLVSLRFAWRAAQAERRASAEAGANQRMVAFLQDDLLSPAAVQAQPVWDLRWRGVLDRAAARIARRFDGEPELAAGMHMTLGSSYRTLGDYAAAQHHYERALYFRRQLGPLTDATALAVADGLSAILHVQRNFPYGQRLWSTLAAVSVEAPAAQLHALRQLARWEAENRNHAAAARHAEQALALAAAEFGAGRRESLESLVARGFVHRLAGQEAAAVTAHERALAELQRTFGATDASALAAARELAMSYRIAGRHEEAVRTYRDLIAHTASLQGADHPDVVAIKADLAFVYQDAGRYAEAIALGWETVRLHQRLMGPEHPLTLGAMTNVAFQQQLGGLWDDAIATHKEVLAIRERVNGPRDAANAQSLFGIGTSYRVSGRAAAAEPWLRRAHELRTANFGATHRETLIAGSELGLAFVELGKFSESERLLAGVVSELRHAESDSWHAAVAASRWAESLMALGRFAEAEAALQSAMTRLDAPGSESWPATQSQARETALRFERLYSLTGRPAESAAARARAAALAPH